MSVDMWNCHSWPLDVSNNLSEYFMSNSVHMHFAFGYHEQHWTVKMSLCCLSNVTGGSICPWLSWTSLNSEEVTLLSVRCELGGYIISFTEVKLTYPYIFLSVDFSLYFPISWLFWMGSHWSHWIVKSSLCAVAVLMGVYCKFHPGKTDFSSYQSLVSVYIYQYM